MIAVASSWLAFQPQVQKEAFLAETLCPGFGHHAGPASPLPATAWLWDMPMPGPGLHRAGKRESAAALAPRRRPEPAGGQAAFAPLVAGSSREERLGCGQWLGASRHRGNREASPAKGEAHGGGKGYQ